MPVEETFCLYTELLEVWPIIYLWDTGRYLVAAGALALLLAGLTAVGVRLRRIQDRRPSRADLRREILTSLRTALLFSLIGFFVIYLGARAGLFTLYGDFSQAGWGYLLLSLAGMLVLHDAYFYWTHRLMHHPRLFRWFHHTHHLSRTPTAFAAYAFAVPEALVQAAFMPLYLLFVPMHEAGLAAFMVIMILRNVMGHAGIELHPRGWVDAAWLGWISTTTHHDLHHAVGRYNYGLYFTWWDRWMGTEHPDYRARFRAVTSLRQADAPAFGPEAVDTANS